MEQKQKPKQTKTMPDFARTQIKKSAHCFLFIMSPNEFITSIYRHYGSVKCIKLTRQSFAARCADEIFQMTGKVTQPNR